LIPEIPRAADADRLLVDFAVLANLEILRLVDRITSRP
jgi:hypothetical protein